MEKKFNSQICTTLEQSKRLLSLGLKPETADCYIREEEYGFSNWIGKPSLPTDVPAWSLHRLLVMLYPREDVYPIMPTIANDSGMQEDAYRYAAERIKNLRVSDVQVALKNAYKNGAISAFATGYRCGYNAVEPDYKDSINFYKRRLNTLAQEAHDNALKRGKITKGDAHEARWSGIWQELDEFHHATDEPSEHLPQYTQRAMEMGLFELKKTTINKPDGSVLVSTTTKVTGKGQIYFVDKFLRQAA